MDLPQPESASTELAVAKVERSVKLDSLDGVLGLQTGTLAALNPALRRQATPRRAYDLRVPAGQEEVLLARLESVPVWTPPQPRYTTYRVRSGDTLSVIAGRYRTSVSAIMRANGLRSANRLRVGQRLRIPTRGAEVAAGGS
jgi:membrane-bound lytic murein transglycosylase D